MSIQEAGLLNSAVHAGRESVISFNLGSQLTGLAAEADGKSLRKNIINKLIMGRLNPDLLVDFRQRNSARPSVWKEMRRTSVVAEVFKKGVKKDDYDLRKSAMTIKKSDLNKSPFAASNKKKVTKISNAHIVLDLDRKREKQAFELFEYIDACAVKEKIRLCLS
jgi:hypothetical protein